MELANKTPWPGAGGDQQITSLASAVGLTIPKDAKGREPRFALLEAEAQEVRFRDNGSDPTASVGQILPVKSGFWYDGDLHAIKFIEVAGGAKLNVSFYR